MPLRAPSVSSIIEKMVYTKLAYADTESPLSTI